MSNFTKEIEKVYEFDGDTVTVNMNRLERKDAMTLAPYMNQTDEGIGMSFADSVSFMGVASDILPGYINSMDGLYIEGVNAAKGSEEFDLIFKQTYFMSLVSEMLGDLVSNSFVTKSEAEDIKKQQDDILMDLEPIKLAPSAD